MLSVYSVKAGKITPGKVEDLRDEKIGAWVDLHAPTPDELALVAKELDAPLEELKHAARVDQRPRIMDIGGHTVVIFGALVAKELRMTPVIMIISKWKDIVTIRQKDVAALQRLHEEAAQGRIDSFRNAAATIYNIMDESIIDFFRSLDALEDRMEVLETQLVRNPQGVRMAEILTVKKTLTRVHKVLSANREVVARVERDHVASIDKKQVKRFHELYNHLFQLIDLEETLRDVLTTMMEIHVSSVSNELNLVMKRLTVVATVLLIPTLIAGIYGMNFRHMPEIEWAFGYPFSLALMAAAMFVALFFFKKLRWL